jgi:hypothetical protein
LSNHVGLGCSDDGGDTIRSNLISGNEGDGMSFSTDTNAGDFVVGNLIGTDLSGTRALSNRGYGINAGTAPNSVVAGNLLSGNIIGIGLGSSFNNRPPTPGILVQGNRIGTDATGTVAMPNLVGLEVLGRSTNNTIDSNVIAGNAQDGVLVRDDRTTGNIIQHNLIGLTSAGDPLPNGLHGVEIDNGASGNTVADNLVEFNGGHGIVLHDAGTTGNAVQGNNSSFNAGAGVLVAAGASGNSVGGTASGQGNLLSDNGQAGAWVFGAGTTGVPIEGNSIVGNGGLGGIALTGGANNNQAPPTLVYAASTGPNDTSVSGTLSGAANTTYRVELFDSPSGGGQGQTFLGFLNVTTDSNGNATFLDHFAEALTSLTATATDPNNNTSPFSAPVAVARL